MLLNNIMYYSAIAVYITLGTGMIRGFFSWRKLNAIGRWILLFLSCAFLIDTIARLLADHMGNTLYFLSLSTIPEFVFFSVLYTRFFFSSTSMILSIFLALVLVGLILFQLSYSSPDDFLDFQLFNRFVTDLVLIVLALKHYRDALVRDNQDPFFKTNTIILVYLIIDFLVALTVNFLVNAPLNIVFLFWVLRLISLSLLYFNFIYLIWQNGKIQRL